MNSSFPARCGEDGAAGGLGGPEPAAPVPFDDLADCLACYHEAVRVIGERVKAGASVPAFFLPRKHS